MNYLLVINLPDDLFTADEFTIRFIYRTWFYTQVVLILFLVLRLNIVTGYDYYD